MIYQGPIEPPQWYVLQGILHPINDLAFQNGFKIPAMQINHDNL